MIEPTTHYKKNENFKGDTNTQDDKVDYKFRYTTKGYLVLLMVSRNKEEFIEQLFLNGYGKYENNIIKIKSYPSDVYYFRIALATPDGKVIKEPYDFNKMGKFVDTEKLPEEKLKALTIKH